MTITIPVYYTKEYARKPSKTFLLSLNWYRNAFHSDQNDVKQYMHEIISNQLKSAKPIDPPLTVTYKYFYEASNSDLSNVGPLASKWLLDTLKTKAIIPDDNVKLLVEEIYQVAHQDKLNPRIEATITTKEN